VGIKVYDILNDDPFGKTLPVIIVSALAKEKNKPVAFKKVIVGYLTKSAEKDVLITQMENILHCKSKQ